MEQKIITEMIVDSTAMYLEELQEPGRIVNGSQRRKIHVGFQQLDVIEPEAAALKEV